jgi:ribosomal protein S18 acetylase RimI-like enzyme
MKDDYVAPCLFRKARPEDAEQLAEMAYELNLFHGEDIRISPDVIRRDWPHIEAYVVEQDGALAGFLSGFDNYQFHTATLRFEIQNLHVREKARRKGIGRILMQGVIKEKYRAGIRKFSLGVMAHNQQARMFYESMGFAQRPVDNLRYVLTGESLEKIIMQDEE